MGCGCSRKAAVDEDPLPLQNAKASHRSSAEDRYGSAFQRNSSRPLSGLLPPDDREEEVRRKRLQQQQHQIHLRHEKQQQQQQQQHHIHLRHEKQQQQQQQQLRQRKQQQHGESVNPKYDAQKSEFERVLSSRSKERDAGGALQNRRRTLVEEGNPSNIPEHNEGGRVGAVRGELVQNSRRVPGEGENPKNIPQLNEGGQAGTHLPREKDRRVRENTRHNLAVQENLRSIPKHGFPGERDREYTRHNPAVHEIPRNIPRHNEGEQVAAGWPAWLSSVAGEAIKGWIPRRSSSFEKLEKIGQGTYSNVYKARDLESRNFVALKKVRFDLADPESVKFMAREIIVLRRLDHPNVIKLEGVITSRMSSSLYLVFEYMEHDLAGLASSPGVHLSEPQVKLYMSQLLSGLQHCHDRNILHRDIKGSNLLLNNTGMLKIADFGLATLFGPSEKRALTSRVVTLWYRAPELLLGAVDYGVGVDLWSVGCILAELFAGKPIMPARTEVEQLHKIFKMCGSPSEEYWEKSKLPHATIFKPQQPYKRCITETFKDFPATALALVDTLLAIEPSDRGTARQALRSQFFTTPPYACDRSSLPQYLPSKEWDAKMRDEENRRRREKGRNEAAQNHANGGEDYPSKAVPPFDANAEFQANLQERQGKRTVETEIKEPAPSDEPLQLPKQLQLQPQLGEEAVVSKERMRTYRSGPLAPQDLLSEKDAIDGEGLRMVVPRRPDHSHKMPKSDAISSSRSGPLGPRTSTMTKDSAMGEGVRMGRSHRDNMSRSRAVPQEESSSPRRAAAPPISSMSGPLGPPPSLSKKKAIGGEEDVRMAPPRLAHRRNNSISNVISQSSSIDTNGNIIIDKNNNNNNNGSSSSKGSVHKELLKDLVALSQRFGQESFRIPSYFRKNPQAR